MEEDKLDELSMEELLTILDKRTPSAKEWKEIKRKVLAIRDEMNVHLETCKYFEKLMKKKKQISN